MSYRERIFKIKKDEYNKFKNITLFELKSKYKIDYYEFYYDVLNKKELHEFGNGLINTSIKEYKFLKDKELHSLINNDTRLIKLTKNQLKSIIDNAIKEVKKANRKLKMWADDLVSDNENNRNLAIKMIQNSINREFTEWEGILTINFDDNDILLDSWMLNYDVFNLIYIYKTTDWKNYVIGLYGS
jgi:DNA integrity scanning protein DisA with diadenylate cyclase activity